MAAVHSAARHVDDRVLAEIRAKLSAARQAVRRPAVSYRAGQAPAWALDAAQQPQQPPQRQQPVSGSQWRRPAPAEGQVDVTDRAAVAHAASGSVAAAARQSSADHSAVGATRATSAAELAVPEPEDDADDERDSDIRRRRNESTASTDAAIDAELSSDGRPHRTGGDSAELEQAGDSDDDVADGDDDGSVSSLGSSPPSSLSPSSPSGRPLLVAPVFKPRSARATLDERAAVSDDEWRSQQAEQQQADRRRQHSRQQLQRELDRAAQRAKRQQLASSYGVRQSELSHMPDDGTDGEQEDAERDAWKLRELQRLARDRDALRRLTGQHAEPEGGAEEGRRPASESGESRSGSLRYLQRYYHVGAFFADERAADAAFNRDFNAATGEDRAVDKALLPAVMQVKRFGLKGRTKYTHLRDQDTAADAQQRRQHSGQQHIARAAEVGVRGYAGKGAAG